MDAVRSLIIQNHSILDPALRTTCGLIGLTMLAAASFSLFSPQEFSYSVFRLPLPPFTPPTTPTKSSSISSNKGSDPKTLPAANPKAWLLPFAGREAALGCTILGLLWLGELRILSLMFLPMMFVGVADTAAVAIYGEKGEWMVHGVPSLCFSWIAPAGLVLYGGF